MLDPLAYLLHKRVANTRANLTSYFNSIEFVFETSRVFGKKNVIALGNNWSVRNLVGRQQSIFKIWFSNKVRKFGEEKPNRRTGHYTYNMCNILYKILISMYFLKFFRKWRYSLAYNQNKTRATSGSPKILRWEDIRKIRNVFFGKWG